MSNRRRSDDATGMVTWGWYAVVEIPEVPPNQLPARVPDIIRVGSFDPRTGTSEIIKAPVQLAFWAAWWTQKPARDPWVDPDNFGFVVGPQAWGHAITVADRAVREGPKGRRVYALHVGEDFARIAFRDGAPIIRSEMSDFAQLGMQSLAFFKLDTTASEAKVRAAFRAMAKEKHPDRGGLVHNMHDLVNRKDLAIGFLRMQRQKLKGQVKIWQPKEKRA